MHELARSTDHGWDLETQTHGSSLLTTAYTYSREEILLCGAINSMASLVSQLLTDLVYFATSQA